MVDNSYYTGGGPTYLATQMAAGNGPYGSAAGYNAWLDTQIANARQAGRHGTAVQGFQYSDYSPSEQEALKRQYQTYVNQTNASNQINKAFDSFRNPGGYYSQVYQNTLNPAMAGINRQYQDAARHQTFIAADRGLIGGSQDVFQKSRLGDAATMATQQAELGAQQAESGVEHQYEAVRNQLLQQLYNPNNADQASSQSYQAALQGLAQGQGGLNQSSLDALGITANYNQLSSQNMGNLFNTAAGIVNASPYINGSSNQGMSSAFHGWTSGLGSTYQQAGTGGYGSSQLNYNQPGTGTGNVGLNIGNGWGQ